MSETVMMSLGDFRFSPASAAWRTLERTAAWRWRPHARVGRTPSLQYLGPEAETIELEGTIFPHFRGGLGQIETIRSQAAGGEPVILVDGLGNVWGKYCIRRVAETRNHPGVDGIPRRIDFRIELEEYGADG